MRLMEAKDKDASEQAEEWCRPSIDSAKNTKKGQLSTGLQQFTTGLHNMKVRGNARVKRR